MNDEKKIEFRKWGDHVVECDMQTVLDNQLNTIDNIAKAMAEEHDKRCEETIINKFCEIIKSITPVRKNIALGMLEKWVERNGDDQMIREKHLIPDKQEFERALEIAIEETQAFFSNRFLKYTINGLEWVDEE